MTDDEVKEKLLALKKMAEDMARYAQSLINEIELKKRGRQTIETTNKHSATYSDDFK